MSETILTSVPIEGLWIGPNKCKFRCSKGHEWEAYEADVHNMVVSYDNKHSRPICGYCWVEMHEQMCGIVGRVDDPVPDVVR